MFELTIIGYPDDCTCLTRARMHEQMHEQIGS